MAFEVPRSKKSVKQDRFEYTIDGETYSVRRLKFVPMGTRVLISSDPEAALDFFGLKGTKQGDAVRDLIEEEYDALTSAWQEDSDVTVGESEASST